MRYLLDSIKIFKNALGRLRKKNFSGTTGIAVKNSYYQILVNLTSKIGSIIFTIILARILLPDLFGLYSLALSTIMIFTAFSDLGINQTITRFISKGLRKNNNKKTKAYLFYLGKIKLAITFFSIAVLAVTAGFISEDYYQKPLYLALIVGSFYILFSTLFVILKSLLEAMNNFRLIFYQEILFQTSRIILVPGILLFILKFISSDSVITAYIIAGLSFSYLISFLFYLVHFKKLQFSQKNDLSLTEKEKSNLRKFILATSSIILSGVFFSYIDKVILGYYVQSEFIGYYAAAFGLINSSVILITFSTALLPVFSRLEKKEMDLLYKKAIKIILPPSILLFLFFLLFASPIIGLIYGESYSLSINILKLFSLLLVIIPIISMSTTYLIAIGKPAIISKVLIITTTIHILLNYILISRMTEYGQLFGVYGAVIATLASNILCAFMLISYKNRVKRQVHNL